MTAQRTGLSQRAAAALLGVSQPRIAELVGLGRISKDPDGSLNELSVRRCQQTLDARRGPDKGDRAISPPDKALIADKVAAGTVSPGDLPRDWAGLDHAEAVRLKECGIAWLRNLEAQEKAGQLVPVDAVAAEWESVCGAIREKVLGLASRATARLGLGADGREVLDGLVREALVDLSASD